ncbi:ferrous iron transport protein B [Arcobacter sp. FWKO B]|uniref:ferrous iron transport protein B n=1 Tax=Arcobacter sp. FWKO B TaxID=2593672 RepID=UPI0018A3AAD4|nr:ferrous iron transport protein B [Arcobacter sp. FWKO B]QOG12562.1 ferrous iron transport protein B [Arcobacter sp. FWKO B]
MTPIKIVLAGQPNVGKSMLINSISKSNLKVGNFSGVTVEKTEVCFEHDCHIFELVDLPGTYSIDGFSKEEIVAKDYLANNDYDVIVNVIDSTHLQRNLLLTMELARTNKKIVIALNMDDEAQKEGIFIDVEQFCAITGIKAVKVSASKKTGIDNLLQAIHDVYEEPRCSHKIIYNDSIEQEIFHISMFLEQKNFLYKDLTNREIAIRLIAGEKELFKVVHEHPIYLELQPLLLSSLNNIYEYYETKNIKDIFKKEDFAIAKGLTTEVVSQKIQKSQNLTQKIDSILINKFAGIPIFLFFMWALFQITFELGSIPMDYIEVFFGSLSEAVSNSLGDGLLRDMIADGIIPGVGAVVLFLPNIVILYIGIALLETTGYMSRVAFLFDGFFHKFGLHGKSFIPLVTGFGCSVPAYMAARTLKSEKDRLITLFVIGFMSCGARLPVYVLFVGTFFASTNAGNVLFAIYIAGAFMGLLMAKLLRVTAFKGADEPFVMEMPKYRLPTLRLLWFTVSNNAYLYLKKAGTFILAASVLIWVASTYPKNYEMIQEYESQIELLEDEDEIAHLELELSQKSLEQSYLGIIGKSTEFLFAPLGFDWKLTIALEAGLAAKEVIVATLGILYNVGIDLDEESTSLQQALAQSIPLPTAVAFIVFVMLYLPCLAASVVFAKEAGGYKYLGYLFVFTTATAWIMSFIAYNLVLILL